MNVTKKELLRKLKQCSQVQVNSQSHHYGKSCVVTDFSYLGKIYISPLIVFCGIFHTIICS